MIQQILQRTADETYRQTEKLLNDFKNKRIGYSEFIDRQQSFILTHQKQAIREVLESLKKDMDDFIESDYEGGYYDAVDDQNTKINQLLEELNYPTQGE